MHGRPALQIDSIIKQSWNMGETEKLKKYMKLKKMYGNNKNER